MYESSSYGPLAHCLRNQGLYTQNPLSAGFSPTHAGAPELATLCPRTEGTEDTRNSPAIRAPCRHFLSELASEFSNREHSFVVIEGNSWNLGQWNLGKGPELGIAQSICSAQTSVNWQGIRSEKPRGGEFKAHSANREI
jgi:hypothetical protein